MAKYLKLYSNLTPNIDGGIFTVCEKSEDLLACYKNYELKTLTLDNYRINNNIATINGNINGITYLIDYEDNDGNITYLCCYNVVSETLQSGYTILGLKIDLWNTYISDTNLTYGTITRCNRLININGIYDSIDKTSLRPYSKSVMETEDVVAQNIEIVFLLEFNIEQAVFGDNGITKTQLFSANLQDLKDAVNTDGTYNNVNALNIAVSVIGGIYQAKTTWGEGNDARVLNAWLVPTRYLNFKSKDGTYNINVVSKSQYSNSLTFEVKTAMPNKAFLNVDYEMTTDEVNNDFYGGTFNNGIKLTRYANKTLHFTYMIITTDSDIKVIVQDGQNQKEITSEFEILLTTNASQTTTFRNFARAYNTAVNGTGAVLKTGITQGPAMGVLKAGTFAFSLTNQENYNSSIGGGDGYLNYFNTWNDEESDYNNLKVKWPFVLTWTHSLTNENLRASYYGCNFANYYKTKTLFGLLKEVSAKNLIYNGDNFNPYTFVKIEGSFKDVPLEALNFIKAQLKNGINYYIFTNDATK